MKFLDKFNEATAEQQDRWFGYVCGALWLGVLMGLVSMLATG